MSNKPVCIACGGRGWNAVEVPHMERVTREMALDAGDSDLEGSEVVFGSDYEQQPCQNCNGTGFANDQPLT